MTGLSHRPSPAIRCRPALAWTFVFTALIAGCAGTPGGGAVRPDWVDGPAERYPANQYLLGRGSAESVDLAQERARADLAKVFEVTVAVESSDRQRAATEGGTTRYEAASEQRVVTRTEQVVRGLRIAELWAAPSAEGGRQHALAVLPRLQAATGLRQEIASRDEAIERAVARAQTAGDALERAGHAYRAVELAAQRAGFDKSLRVVDVRGRGVDTAYGAARLQGDLDALLKRIVLKPRLMANGDAADEALLPLLQGAIAQAGFLTADVGGEAKTTEATAYEATFSLRLDERFEQGWHWVRGNVELTLRDGAGKVRGSKAWPVKASAQDKAAARARARLEIERLLNEALRPAVLGFAAS